MTASENDTRSHHPMWAGSGKDKWTECSRCGARLWQDFYQWVDKHGGWFCNAV